MVFVIACLDGLWGVYLPPPGVSIGILGLVAAFMAVRAVQNWSITEKVVWIAISFALLVVELKSIYHDRDVHDVEQAQMRIQEDEARRKEREAFAREEKEFAKTEKAFEGLFRANNWLLAETTGGNSYMYFDFSMVIGPVGNDTLPTSVLSPGESLCNAFPKLVGQFPLNHVFVSTVGPKGWLHDIDYGTMFPSEIGRKRPILEMTLVRDKPKQFFTIWISTSTGSYEQIVFFERHGDGWVWANRLYKYPRKTPLRSWASPGFPLDDLKKNWN